MMRFADGLVTKSARISVLEILLETPEIISAIARGSDLTEEQVRSTIRNVIDDLDSGPNSPDHR
jgi:hypothetical protein